MKTLLAVALALGFLALESKAKTSVAFLGIDPDTDPLFSRALSTLIYQELEADTSLASRSRQAVGEFLAKAALERPDAGPRELPRLKQHLEASYYAYGRLEDLTVANKRVWWAPWSVKTNWSRALRLRVVDAANGETVFDGLVPAQIPEKHFLHGPDGNLSRQSALDRDRQYRRILPFLSAETAKALAKVIADKGAKPATP